MCVAGSLLTNLFQRWRPAPRWCASTFPVEKKRVPRRGKGDFCESAYSGGLALRVLKLKKKLQRGNAAGKSSGLGAV